LNIEHSPQINSVMARKNKGAGPKAKSRKRK